MRTDVYIRPTIHISGGSCVVVVALVGVVHSIAERSGPEQRLSLNCNKTSRSSMDLYKKTGAFKTALKTPVCFVQERADPVVALN